MKLREAGLAVTFITAAAGAGCTDALGIDNPYELDCNAAKLAPGNSQTVSSPAKTSNACDLIAKIVSDAVSNNPDSVCPIQDILSTINIGCLDPEGNQTVATNCGDYYADGQDVNNALAAGDTCTVYTD